MTAPTGVGKENFNWWLKNVWLIPYTWEEIWTNASGEKERGWATLKLEEYRNRNLPPLKPAATKEEWLRRYHDMEDTLTKFIVDGKFFSASADELAAAYAGNLPRPRLGARPRNFFYILSHEHIGHQLDGLRDRTGQSPIRKSRRLHEMTHARREGVANGLGAMLIQAGILDDQPRWKESFAAAQANRGMSALGELLFQANELDYAGWNKFGAKMRVSGPAPLDNSNWWNAWATYNTWNHKKDAVQAPGYELAYVTGFIQHFKLLGDRAHQLGEDFNMREFLDEFFAAGQMPYALIRWEMTGLTDEIEKLW
jgi:hypothetical protein